MTAALTEDLQRIEQRRQAHLETAGLAAYAKRAQWSRTATARWLDDRRDAVNAAALRLGLQLGQVSPLGKPVLPRQPGHALKTHHVRVFDRIHAALAAAASDKQRDALLVPDLFR